MTFNIKKQPTPKLGDFKVKEEFVLYRRIDNTTVVILGRVVTVREYQTELCSYDKNTVPATQWKTIHSELPKLDIELQINRLRKEYKEN